MAASGRATCHADVSITSAWGPPNACVIMAFDDVSIDLVNVDQVNRSTSPHVSGVSWAHVSAALCKRARRHHGKVKRPVAACDTI